MPGVPRELAEHTLNIDPKFKPVKQFLRRFNEERRKAIGEEVVSGVGYDICQRMAYHGGSE